MVALITRRRPRRKLFRLEHLVYRTAGLPVALRAIVAPPANVFDRALVHQFWRPHRVNQWLELIGAMVLLPVSLPAAVAFYLVRNGRTIRRREGVTIGRQCYEMFSAYVAAGVLPPWYYAFELYRDRPPRRAKTFLHRFNTHGGVYDFIKGGSQSPLNDKRKFAEHCAAAGIPHVSQLLYLDKTSQTPPDLPQRDLFVKPVSGRGGKGAERWDLVSESLFRTPSGEQLSGAELAAGLCRRARKRALLVQPRMIAHEQVRRLSTGALSTVRVLTCVNEQGDPEVVEATFRMSIGRNGTVDNIHAGGIAAEVCLDNGEVGKASNLGFDARLGWLSIHPDTGATIEGLRLPCWAEVKALAVRAHRAFDDRILIGWDIAILDDGPILIEGNSSPDLDLHQRPALRGLVASRAGQLLAAHLKARLG